MREGQCIIGRMCKYVHSFNFIIQSSFVMFCAVCFEC